MSIRQATISDAEGIARIHVDTWRAAYQGIVPDGYLAKLSKPKRQQRWEESLTKSADGTIVTEDSKHGVVGWASFGISRDDDAGGQGELYAIYLDSDFWGKGYGRELLGFAVDELKRSGFNAVTLWVLEKNMRTRRFYEMAGFAADGTEKTITIEGIDLVEMRYRMTIPQQGGSLTGIGPGAL